MLKSILHIAVSSVLIFTILAPPVFSLLDIEVVAITMQEEKKEKQEKELEENTFFFAGLLRLKALIADEEAKLITFYNEALSNYTSKIILPPPESGV